MNASTPEPIRQFDYKPLNAQDEYWFIRWIFVVRKYKIAKAKIIHLEDIINNHNDKKLIHKLQTENHQLQNMLAIVREKFIPINPTKHTPKKSKRK